MNKEQGKANEMIKDYIQFIKKYKLPTFSADDLRFMIINKSGIAIRMEVNSLRVMGRATQGVRLINLKDNDSIAAVAKVVLDDEDVQDIDDIEVVDDDQIN